MHMPTSGAQLKADVLLYKEYVYVVPVASSWTFNVSSWTSATSSSWTIFTSASSSPEGGEQFRSGSILCCCCYVPVLLM